MIQISHFQLLSSTNQHQGQNIIEIESSHHELFQDKIWTQVHQGIVVAANYTKNIVVAANNTKNENIDRYIDQVCNEKLYRRATPNE